MNELKKIRATKYKNKQRYKDKSKIVPKPESKEKEPINTEDKIIIDDDSRPFQSRVLESNWYRYEPKEDEVHDSSKNFSLLASVPISQGGYFQFKSDKTISDEVENQQVENKLFQLNLNLLNKGIATIPFHVRCGIDEKYLSESQLKYMQRTTDESVQEYESYLETRRKEIEEQLSANSKTKGVIDVKDNEMSVQSDFEKLELGEAQGGVSLQRNTRVAGTSSEKSVGGGEDLEQWLDDILDD